MQRRSQNLHHNKFVFQWLEHSVDLPAYSCEDNTLWNIENKAQLGRMIKEYYYNIFYINISEY